MKILCTFSGQFGDILWSLPTVRKLSQINGCKVDMGIMPSFRSLLPLLREQSYINRAFVIEEWQEIGRPFGCQPWQSPSFEGKEKYERVYDLTYRSHPTYSLPVWTLYQNGSLGISVEIPFIEVPNCEPRSFAYVAYAFNPMYADRKAQFLADLVKEFPESALVRVDMIPWLEAAQLIKGAVAFLGCRSANYVLAHGLGQRVIVFEPAGERHSGVFAPPVGVGIERQVLTAREAGEQIAVWIHEDSKKLEAEIYGTADANAR